jgi:hypothetical protein
MARAKQYADRVNVIKRIKVNGKWPFAPVVERSGRIVRDHVWVSGREERPPKDGTIWSGIRGASAAGKPLPASIRSSKPPAKNPLSSMLLEPVSSDPPRFLRFLPPKGEPSSRPSRTISTT